MKFTTKTNLVRSTFTALFAALICVGCFISIPLPGGVPITIQNMFAALSGLVLGGIQGAGAVGLFLVLGAVGIPVFSGVTGGLAVLQGPTGGFLFGYFIGALLAGLILGSPIKNEKKHTHGLNLYVKIILAALVAFAMQYAIGIPWFISSMSAQGKAFSFAKALSATLIPFIPGDSIKIVLSVILTAALRPVAVRYLYPDDEKEAAELLEKLKQKSGKA